MADLPPPPPPPENPFASGAEDASGFMQEGNSTLDAGRPAVAARPGRALAVVGIVGAVIALLVFGIVSGDEPPPPPPKEEQEARPVVEEVNAPQNIVDSEPPPLPDLPSMVPAPPPPMDFAPIAIPEPVVGNPGVINPEQDAATREQQLQRMKSNMMVTDNGGGSRFSGSEESGRRPQEGVRDRNSMFEASINTGGADRVQAQSIGNTNIMIAQGRLIHATLESAINTDLPAPIRAIVSRDTYAESGRAVLIPKGSRLIGNYNTDLTGGQTRVFIVWTRIIRPDGIDIPINSPLVDQLGQSGMGGQVDTKFQQIFSRSVMSSVMSIAMALGSDELGGGSATQVNQGGLGGSQTTGDAATLATVNALNRLGQVSDSFIQRFIDSRQTIIVDQGAVVNVFVNRDIEFPPEAVFGTRVLN